MRGACVQNVIYKIWVRYTDIIAIIPTTRISYYFFTQNRKRFFFFFLRYIRFCFVLFRVLRLHELHTYRTLYVGITSRALRRIVFRRVLQLYTAELRYELILV